MIKTLTILCISLCFAPNMFAKDKGIPTTNSIDAVKYFTANTKLKGIAYLPDQQGKQTIAFSFNKKDILADDMIFLKENNLSYKLMQNQKVVIVTTPKHFSSFLKLLSTKSKNFKNISIVSDDPDIIDYKTQKNFTVLELIREVFRKFPNQTFCEIQPISVSTDIDIFTNPGLLPKKLEREKKKNILSARVKQFNLVFLSIPPVEKEENPNTKKEISIFIDNWFLSPFIQNANYKLSYYAYFYLPILSEILNETKFLNPIKEDNLPIFWSISNALFCHTSKDKSHDKINLMFLLFNKLQSVKMKSQFVLMYFPDKRFLSESEGKRIESIITKKKEYKNAYLMKNWDNSIKWKGDDIHKKDDRWSNFRIPEQHKIKQIYLDLKFNSLDKIFDTSKGYTNAQLLEIKNVKKHEANCNATVFEYLKPFKIGGIPLRSIQDTNYSSPENAFISALSAKNFKWYSQSTYDPDSTFTPFDNWTMWNTDLKYFIEVLTKVDIVFHENEYAFLIYKYFNDKDDIRNPEQVSKDIVVFTKTENGWKEVECINIYLHNLSDFILTQIP